MSLQPSVYRRIAHWSVYFQAPSLRDICADCVYYRCRLSGVWLGYEHTYIHAHTDGQSTTRGWWCWGSLIDSSLSVVCSNGKCWFEPYMRVVNVKNSLIFWSFYCEIRRRLWKLSRKCWNCSCKNGHLSLVRARKRSGCRSKFLKDTWMHWNFGRFDDNVDVGSRFHACRC